MMMLSYLPLQAGPSKGGASLMACQAPSAYSA